MEQTKRKRLEAAGWHTGSAADFVGLTAEESAYVELRVRLSDALKAKRLAVQMSQKSVAMALESSQSRVAKMEAADPSVSLDLLIRGLLALGVSRAELGRIVSFENKDVVTALVNPKPKRKRVKSSSKIGKKKKHPERSRHNELIKE